MASVHFERGDVHMLGWNLLDFVAAWIFAALSKKLIFSNELSPLLSIGRLIGNYYDFWLNTEKIRKFLIYHSWMLQSST